MEFPRNCLRSPGGDEICEGWIDRRRGSNGKNNNRRQHRNSSTDETTTTTNTSVSNSNAVVQSNNKKNDTEWRRTNDNMMNAERRKQWKRIATGFGRVTVRKNSWGFIRCLKSEPMLIDAPTRFSFT